MPKFAGIDPSLTRAGVVTYNTETQERYVASFSSPNSGASVADKHHRLMNHAEQIVKSSMLTGGKPTIVAIEAPAFSSNTGKAWDRAGLWWYVVRLFMENGCTVIEIPPTSRAKYATGKGNAGKDEVMLAVSRNYPEFDIKNNDEADAVALCAMIARLAGSPYDGDIPKNRLEAITKLEKDIQWVK